MKRDVIEEQMRPASAEYGVASLRTKHSPKMAVCHKPCAQCPWRKDVPTGVFPAEAYRLSAPTAYDAAMSTFACHMKGRKAVTCAGFMMRHSENNLAVRLNQTTGRVDLRKVTDGGFPLYRSYTDMAVANGVDPKDPVLKPVRANGQGWRK